jgi:hypothetical protein
VVVLTAAGEGKLLRSRRVSRFAEDGDGVRLETGAGSLAGFELAVEGGRDKGVFLGGRLKEALKKISAGLRPVIWMKVSGSRGVFLTRKVATLTYRKSERIKTQR